MLRSMMDVINGNQKLRVYDTGINEIVDENEQVIDSNYVRKELELQQEGRNRSQSKRSPSERSSGRER